MGGVRGEVERHPFFEVGKPPSSGSEPKEAAAGEIGCPTSYSGPKASSRLPGMPLWRA